MWLEMKIKDCRDCPWAHEYISHGEWHEYIGHGDCWTQCNHKNAPKFPDCILWGCQEQFKEIPRWCPVKWGGC